MKRIFQAVKKKIILVLMCSGIVLTCWWALFNHYHKFGHDGDLITVLESKILDLRFFIRGKQPPQAKVGILAIDEKSIEKFGRWPFSRHFYGPALKNLKKAGVKWIGFDAIFSEPERPSLEDAKSTLTDISKTLSNPKITKENLRNQVGGSLDSLNNLSALAPGDRDLMAGIKEFENVVLGYFYFNTEEEVTLGGRGKNPFAGLDFMANSSLAYDLPEEIEGLEQASSFVKSYGIVPNTEKISSSTDHFAFFSNASDLDAINRWVTVVRVLGTELMPSLALKMAAEYLKSDILTVFDTHGRIRSVELIDREDQSKSLKIPTDPLGEGRVLINHRGGKKAFRHISIKDAYYDTFSDEDREYLKNSLLLVGMTAIGINDQRPNPFDPTLDGVENHAAVIDNIVSRDFMQRPEKIHNLELLLLLIIGLIFAPIMIWSRASISGFAGLLFIVGYYYFDKLYWFNSGDWVYMGMPFIEIITLFITITLYKYITEEREKKKVKGAFAHYLSPDVIDQVLEDPESLQLGGIRKELTVFFSDVRGFTTISESLTPEKLCEFMNDYFTPMTGIILQSKGVLDKYIGDAIMAFWGAPVPIPEQADVAADASIEMLYALDRLHVDFDKKGFPSCDIGIGLNTGSMSVGNMGSDERFCYTVMGDAVNLGARLEGLTKEYGIKLMVSEFTVAKFTKNHHLHRDLDDIRVKGKNEPIRVHHLMRPDMLSTESLIRELIGHFELGRKNYREMNWHAARKSFEECLKLYPGDGPSLLYLKRIQEFEENSPGEAWDGVFTFTHK